MDKIGGGMCRLYNIIYYKITLMKEIIDQRNCY
jgi:hypothetical protein